jgi:MFS family permease
VGAPLGQPGRRPAAEPGGTSDESARALRKLVWLVGATLFVDMAAYSAITPLLPGFAEDLSLSKGATGVLGAAFAAGTFVGSLPGGWLAARVGGRFTVLVGLALMGFSALVFGIGGGVVVLDVARFVQGVGGAFTWSGALAWLVAAAPRERRGEIIGAALGAAISGTLAGPALGGLADVVGTFVVFAAFLVLAAMLSALALRLPALPPGFPAEARDLIRLASDRRVYGGMWLIAFPGLSFGVINVLAPLRFDELGAGVATIAAVFLVAAGAEAAMSPLAGRLSDRHGHMVPMRVGLVAVVVLVGLLTVPAQTALLTATIVAVGPALGTLWAPALALVSDVLESLSLDPALGYGLTNLAWAAGAALGAAGGGWLASATADAVPYAMLAMLAVGTLAGVSLGMRRMTVSARA